MYEGPGHRGLAGVLIAKVVCCGGILLVATGALTGFGAWLQDGGLVWLAVAALAVAAWLVQRRRRRIAANAPEDAPTVGHTAKRIE